LAYKSRGSYSLSGGWTKEDFEQFRKSGENYKTDVIVIESNASPKDKMGFTEQTNMKDIIKVGKEINRFKKLDHVGAKEIDRVFKKDADKLITPKSDDSYVTNMSSDFVNGLKREFGGNLLRGKKR
jgi:hypothetical protein